MSGTRITHHLGDECPLGHFDQADLRQCAAWLENRLEGGQKRTGDKLSLRALLRLMQQAGWAYSECQYFDPGRNEWTRRWAFNSSQGSLGGEAAAGGGDTELAIYRVACTAVHAYPRSDWQPRRGW